MITYFTKNISTDKDLGEIRKSLSKMLFKDSNEYFAFFPFCLFDKKYYQYLRKKRQSPYTGKINQNEFNFERQIIYGATTGATSRTIIIKGKISDSKNERKIQLQFQTRPITIVLFFVFIGLIAWLFKDDYAICFFILGFMIMNEIFIITKDIKRIKKINNDGTTG